MSDGGEGIEEWKGDRIDGRSRLSSLLIFRSNRMVSVYCTVRQFLQTRKQGSNLRRSMDQIYYDVAGGGYMESGVKVFDLEKQRSLLYF